MAPSLAVLITAIGVSYFLQNAALLIWSSNPKTFTSVVTGEALSLFGGQMQISTRDARRHVQPASSSWSL